MKQFNPFPDCENFRYGAPMGRHSGNPASLRLVTRLAARRQGGGKGYDRGGAYWGLPSTVWGVWAYIDGDVVCCYVRANSRADAISQIRNPTT